MMISIFSHFYFDFIKNSIGRKLNANYDFNKLIINDTYRVNFIYKIKISDQTKKVLDHSEFLIFLILRLDCTDTFEFIIKKFHFKNLRMIFLKLNKDII